MTPTLTPTEILTMTTAAPYLRLPPDHFDDRRAEGLARPRKRQWDVLLRPDARPARAFAGVAISGLPLSADFGQCHHVDDLHSLRLARRLPVLLDHNLDAVAGETTVVAVADGQLAVSGHLYGDSPAAGEIIAAADAGEQWGLSVTLDDIETEFLLPGVAALINDRWQAGPLNLGFGGQMFEVSFVRSPLDRGTSVTVGRRAPTPPSTPRPQPAARPAPRPAADDTPPYPTDARGRVAYSDLDVWLPRAELEPSTAEPSRPRRPTPFFAGTPALFCG